MSTPRRSVAMQLGVALSACLLFAATPPAISAPAGKPIVASKSKSAEIEVKVDEAFKAYPGLYDNLAAEGRREAAKWRAEADGIYRKGEDTFTFKDGRRYSYARSYDLRSAVGRYISVVRTDDVFTGGAHPNQSIDTILWDTQTKKRISIRPLLKETANKGPTMTALAKLVRAAVFEEKKRRKLETIEGTPDNNEWLKNITPSLLELGPVTLAPSTEAGKSSGLTFHFSPYAVGPYAEGSLTAFVPAAALQDLLSPEGVAIFGGSRPASDIPPAD